MGWKVSWLSEAASANKPHIAFYSNKTWLEMLTGQNMTWPVAYVYVQMNAPHNYLKKATCNSAG